MTTLLDPHVAYERWAETYEASAHNPLMQAEEAVVKRLLAQVPATCALDVGTGSCRYLPILAATGAAAFGIDRSMAMLTRGKGARVCADASCLPFRRATFDVVNASLMVGDIADLAGWAREMARVLTAGGHLIYSDFHPTWVERGWQRTFRDADGHLQVVAFQPHAIDEHVSALEAAGFSVLAIREPRLKIRRRDLPVLAIFHAIRDAGRGRRA